MKRATIGWCIFFVPIGLVFVLCLCFGVHDWVSLQKKRVVKWGWKGYFDEFWKDMYPWLVVIAWLGVVAYLIHT